MRTKIRQLKIGLFLLTLLFLSAIPLTTEALQVRFCVPTCAADPSTATNTKGPGTPSTAGGVTTTIVNIPSFAYKGFTISGTVTSLQSGTLQKITFNPTAITTTATAGCNTTATNPCRIEIIATSNVNDFPAPKPTGGYPAGVFMAGSFTGLQAASPNGDTISMTAEASGLSANNAPLNSDVINATPGAGAGDTLVSLPSNCTGSSTCKFTATALLKSFNTQITETVQQRCDSGVASCRTRLRTTVNINIKRAGNRVNLPAGLVTVDSAAAAAAGINPAAVLIAETLPPFENLDVEHLIVFRKNFALDAHFELDTGKSIDPATEEVYLRVGQFGLTIPAGKFRRFLAGRLFTFFGKVDGLDVAASFARGANPLKWTFAIGVHGTDLTGLPESPAQVSVDLAVGSDTGSDLVTASIFD